MNPETLGSYTIWHNQAFCSNFHKSLIHILHTATSTNSVAVAATSTEVLVHEINYIYGCAKHAARIKPGILIDNKTGC